jgi:hypothetical protein
MPESEWQRLEIRKQQRFVFLHKLYQLGAEDDRNPVPLDDLRQTLDLDKATFERTQRYLEGQKFIELFLSQTMEIRDEGEETGAVIFTRFNAVKLTHKGLVAVERHIMQQRKPRKK